MPVFLEVYLIMAGPKPIENFDLDAGETRDEEVTVFVHADDDHHQEDEGRRRLRDLDEHALSLW